MGEIRMMLMALLVAVLTVGWSVAQEKCCAPGRMQGVLHHHSGRVFADGRHEVIEGYGLFYYDYPGKRYAMDFAEHNDEGKGRKYVVIDLYDTSKRYHIENGQCWHHDLEGDMEPMCIKADAEHVHSSYMGSGAHRLDLNTFTYAHEHISHAEISVTKDGCIPIDHYFIHQRQEDPETVLAMGVDVEVQMDVELAISNTTVFDPPSECDQASSQPEVSHLTSNITNNSLTDEKDEVGSSKDL